ncbi:hypothetical protein ElyMa_001643000 [Elysia marginata]|uniref:Uncharacterized protein n=1 Tax=Elysia marginata TaxID=1093978 RepID=A0AAV4JQ94_9GAST|nr:hypothetical protein ElyMa_001643000 [Elysia marginata]
MKIAKALQRVDQNKKRPFPFSGNWISQSRISADSVKRRWQFERQEQRQPKPTKALGAPVKRKSQFYLSQQMSFLEPHMTHSPMLGNLGSSEPEATREDSHSVFDSGSQDASE